ncbi:ABC transporter ATP-binding protein/permease [Hypericibacter terrae]|uniref:ABC transporter ATP-binding protein/permease n=1 Tax=Hypericibacter terrae TaxID=2602015 RepID=A0A5J6MNM2_9PROT|nr:ABC transporter ATP-binding protein [Hypericibacter terrae]QEX18777.1 ABC transporter ATP-binding protein/permease [Hypericibacter terrae]
MSLFSFFERRLDPTATSADAAPPSGLMAFYWHYVRQVRGLVVALFLTGIAVAWLDTTIPIFIGRIVTLVSTHDFQSFFPAAWPQLLGMAAVLLVARPAALLMQNLVTNQAIAPGLTNLIRWQSHWHVVRQSWTFFQNDFAGRIANRIMQTGPALRESVVASTNAVLYILVYGGTALVVLASHDWWLSIPVVCWFIGYVILLRICVPRMRNRSREMSEVRSALTGRVVDSYTNILTVKLFAKPRDEDDFVREAVDEHTRTFHRQQRLITIFSITLIGLNILMVVGTAAMAMWLWSLGLIAVGTVAMAIPLSWQIANIAGWVAQNVTAIFENVGVVQDGMRSIAVPLQMPDPPNAGILKVTTGHVRFEKLHFGYGTSRGVLHGIDLDIRPGERVGLIGQSGAGKSTLVNLLLRFYNLEQGRILIDGQDIAKVTQESLRAHIAMVTQDTSLLHRSIRDNIRYGRPGATEVEVRDAAAKAHALEFIETLEDWQGRRGFEAHVGERGVKLSGGQRQRIAIARVILKNAPILVLDEATSALDSEVEGAIQEQLEGLMKGRTVIAIAHRLSTIARMDRLIILENGRIVEQGTHAQLLELGGAYAKLWLRQSGGFGAGVLKDGASGESAIVTPPSPEPYSEEPQPLEAVRGWERR